MALRSFEWADLRCQAQNTPANELVQVRVGLDGSCAGDGRRSATSGRRRARAQPTAPRGKEPATGQLATCRRSQRHSTGRAETRSYEIHSNARRPLLVHVALAGGVRLSRVSRAQGPRDASPPACLAVQGLRAADLGDGRDRAARDAHAAAHMVLGGVPRRHAACGISAKELQHQLGLSRYETAWLILPKLRRAMVAPEREPLEDQVEVEEFFLGGLKGGPQLRGGRQRGNKSASPSRSGAPAPGACACRCSKTPRARRSGRSPGRSHSRFAASKQERSTRWGVLLVVVPSSSDAGHELDASSLGIAEETLLAGIVPSQRPASVPPTAVRAGEQASRDRDLPDHTSSSRGAASVSSVRASTQSLLPLGPSKRAPRRTRVRTLLLRFKAYLRYASYCWMTESAASRSRNTRIRTI